MEVTLRTSTATPAGATFSRIIGGDDGRCRRLTGLPDCAAFGNFIEIAFPACGGLSEDGAAAFRRLLAPPDALLLLLLRLRQGLSPEMLAALFGLSVGETERHLAALAACVSRRLEEHFAGALSLRV